MPAALTALRELDRRLLLSFERTAGDEVQGLTADAAAAVDALVTLTRLGDWRVGLGLGEIERPLPESTREARGPAYIAAREAVEAARNAPGRCRLVAGVVGGVVYGDPMLIRDAEGALMLLRSLLSRRTAEGWQICELIDSGVSGRDAAARLGISPSAVSQRLIRAAHAEGLRGIDLATRLLTRAMEGVAA